MSERMSLIHLGKGENRFYFLLGNENIEYHFSRVFFCLLGNVVVVVVVCVCVCVCVCV